jgi:hypothetical protein
MGLERASLNQVNVEMQGITDFMLQAHNIEQ